jgi:hypothetical protein
MAGAGAVVVASGLTVGVACQMVRKGSAGEDADQLCIETTAPERRSWTSGITEQLCRGTHFEQSLATHTPHPPTPIRQSAKPPCQDRTILPTPP